MPREADQGFPATCKSRGATLRVSELSQRPESKKVSLDADPPSPPRVGLNAGREIDYHGASGPVDLDAQGDVQGSIMVWEFSTSGEIVRVGP